MYAVLLPMATSYMPGIGVGRTSSGLTPGSFFANWTRTSSLAGLFDFDSSAFGSPSAATTVAVASNASKTLENRIIRMETPRLRTDDTYYETAQTWRRSVGRAGV